MTAFLLFLLVSMAVGAAVARLTPAIWGGVENASLARRERRLALEREEHRFNLEKQEAYQRELEAFPLRTVDPS